MPLCYLSIASPGVQWRRRFPGESLRARLTPPEAAKLRPRLHAVFTGWSNYGAGKTTIQKTLKASKADPANDRSLEIILEEGDGPNELWKLLNAIATVLTGTAVPLYNQSVHYVRFRTYSNNRVSGECVYRLKNHEFMTVYALPLMLFARSAKTQRLLFKEAADLFKLGCRGDRS